MTRLTLGCRNLLVQVPEIKALISAKKIGRSKTWSDGWIFDGKPYITIEKYSNLALVIITDAGGWQAPNGHNSSRFPQIFVDVWASPTRHDDGSEVSPDADLLIEDVFDAMRPYLHTTNVDVPGRTGDAFIPYMGKPGHPRIWGTAEEISSQTGVRVISSEILGEPTFSDVSDGNGARMGRISVGVHIA